MKGKIAIIFAFLLVVGLVAAVPLSVDDSKFINFSDDLMASAFQVTLRGTPSTDLVTFVPSEQITGTSNSGDVKAKEGFELRSRIISESCDYPVENDRSKKDIYEYILEKEADNIWFWNYNKHADNCYANNDAIFAFSEKTILDKINPKMDVYCFKKKLKAQTGQLKEGRFNFEQKFTLSKEGSSETVTRTIGSLNALQDRDQAILMEHNGEPIARIKWIGGGTWGEPCPGQDDLMAVQPQGEDWISTNKEDYTSYNLKRQDIEDLIDEIEETIGGEGKNPTQEQIDNLRSLVDTTNSRADNAMSPDPIKYNNNYGEMQGSRVHLELPRSHFLYTPDFNVLVNADWLQVVYLVGKPKIRDFSFSSCSEDFDNNQLEVTVQNVGESDGSFVATVNCQEGIQLENTRSSINLKPGTSGTMTIPFTLNLPKDIEQTCQVTVKDTNNPDNRDTARASTECTATDFCSPDGKQRCAGNDLFECQGGQWQVVESNSETCNPSGCDGDGVCEPAQGESFEKCGGEQSPNNDCATCNGDGVCDETETVYSCPGDCGVVPPNEHDIWLYIVAGVLGAIAVFMLIRYVQGLDSKPKNGSKKKPKKK